MYKNKTCCKRESGKFYYDNNASWIEFTPTSTMIIIGEYTANPVDWVVTVSMYREAYQLLNYTAGMTDTEHGRIFANGKTTIDGGNIEADSLAVGAINMTQISDLNTDLGSITAGTLQSQDGKFIIDLNNKTITITV